MISRTEFYVCFLIVIGIIVANIFSADSQIADIQRAKIETLDSVLQVQRDSALALALSKELKADSLQAIVNRRNLDIKIINNKYENEKKNVLVLSADSTLSYFLRTTRGN